MMLYLIFLPIIPLNGGVLRKIRDIWAEAEQLYDT